MGARRKERIGKCIYCGLEPANQSQLGREHILPRSFGGTETLLKASCADCSLETSRVERNASREIFQVLRMLDMHPSERIRVPIADVAFVLPEYHPPTRLLGEGPFHPPDFRLCVSSLPLTQLRSEPHIQTNSTFVFGHVLFAKFLAKIAHCLAIQRYGLGNFDAFLPDLILGHREDTWHLVGGSQIEICSSERHVTKISTTVVGTDRLVLAHLRLYNQTRIGGRTGVPTYQVVVGTLR